MEHKKTLQREGVSRAENSGVKISGVVARVQVQGVTRERGAPQLECGEPSMLD